MKALDYMIDEDKMEYYCDPWSREPDVSNFDSMQGVSGQVNYNGEIFFVTHSSAKHGMGGMDQGSPASVRIVRIDLSK